MVKLAMAYQGDDGLRGFLKGQKELVRDVVSTTRELYGRGHAGGIPASSGVKRQPGEGISRRRGLKMAAANQRDAGDGAASQRGGQPEGSGYGRPAQTFWNLSEPGAGPVCGSAPRHRQGPARSRRRGAEILSRSGYPLQPRSCASTTIWIVYHNRRTKRWWYTWPTSWCRASGRSPWRNALSEARQVRGQP